MSTDYLTLHTAEGLPLYRYVGKPIAQRYDTDKHTPFSSPLTVRADEPQHLARYSREATKAGFQCPIWRHAYTTEVTHA